MKSTLKKISNHSQYSHFGSYLHEQHFVATLLLAFLLHLGGIALYQIIPKEKVEIVPVRVLNIKFGKAPQPVAPSPSPSKATINTKQKASSSKLVEPKKFPAKKLQRKEADKAVKKPAAKKVQSRSKVTLPAKKQNIIKVKPSIKSSAKQRDSKPPAAKQYVREDSMPAVRYDTPEGMIGNVAKSAPTQEYGSPFGNSNAASAEIERRYTQTLSLWLNRFKVYPLEARQAGIGGTVMLRLRINRQGRILQYYLERPSGYPVIDQAITSMVNAANPVPAVPPYYPDSRPYLEFLVPIHFKP